MILVDDDNRKYELKCPNCPPPLWRWREFWGGLLIALVIARIIFI